jgi:hypothetical protein
VREEVAAVAALAAHRGDAKGSKLTARGGAGWDTGWGGCWDGVGIRGEYGEEEREKDKRRLHDDDCLCFCFVHGRMYRALRSQGGWSVNSRTGSRSRETLFPGTTSRLLYFLLLTGTTGEAEEHALALWSNKTGA